MSKRKGQAAMEFLMTYGWAILVVLVVIGALTLFVDLDSLTPNTCNIPTSEGIICEGWSADGTLGSESITLKIKNSLGQDIDIDAVSSLVDDDNNICTLAGLVAIAADDSEGAIFNTDGVGGAGDCSDMIIAGQKTRANINIQITDDDGFVKRIGGRVIISIPESE